MMQVMNGIICTVLSAVSAGAVIAWIYERKLYTETFREKEDLSEKLDASRKECEDLRIELARIDGISQGRECDAMQRRFLESLHENGQSTIRIGRRADA